jgi:hypothetical protein
MITLVRKIYKLFKIHSFIYGWKYDTQMKISECICSYKDSRFSFEPCAIILKMTQDQNGNNYIMLPIQWSFSDSLKYVVV